MGGRCASGRLRIEGHTSLSALTRIQRQLSDGWLLAGRESAWGNVLREGQTLITGDDADRSHGFGGAIY